MLQTILQVTYRANWGVALIDAIFATILLFIIVVLFNRLLPEQSQILQSVYIKSSAVSTCIIFGIILGIRYLFALLGYWVVIFRYLNNEELFFALMITLFYPFLKIFVRLFGRSVNLDIQDLIVGQFKKFFRLFTYMLWIIAGLFLSIALLGIEIEAVDIFYLGFLWMFATAIIDTVIIYLVNTMRPKEKKLPKTIIKNAELTAIIIAFSVWTIQLFVFEIYLKRFFGINLFEQDIRVLFGVVSSIYFITFYVSLKYKFLPSALKESQERTTKAFALIKEEDSILKEIDRSNIVLDVNDLTTYFYTEEGIVKAVDGVSFQIFQGETLGLVGETGCGKSVTALSILQVIRPPGRIEKGAVFFSGENLLEYQ